MAAMHLPAINAQARAVVAPPPAPPLRRAAILALEVGRVRSEGRVATTALALEAFARTLGPDDQVVLEATTNTHSIVRVLRAHAGRVAIANPLRTRLIAEAKIKTDKIDAAVLAQLLAAGFLPEVRYGCPTRRRPSCAGKWPGGRSSSASGPGSRIRSTRSSRAT